MYNIWENIRWKTLQFEWEAIHGNTFAIGLLLTYIANQQGHDSQLSEKLKVSRADICCI